MKIIEPSFVFEDELDPRAIMSKIERAGRTCYKSEGRIGDGTAEKFIASIVSRGHESVLEHASVTARLICDRGVTHEIVRHRIAAYSQESTRYCNYSGDKFGSEITVIRPFFWNDDPGKFAVWREAMEAAEKAYNALIAMGATPQEARSVLPNSLKTELVMTMDLREWRHFLKLRTSPAAHPQMREIALPILKEFKRQLPVLFSDIEAE
ncbi:MAG: FAD-dependent thymidylate synthase [Clostridia bacterium]|nr:FAD-dependent thymidylate synthase [Clostridia bacterium]